MHASEKMTKEEKLQQESAQKVVQETVMVEKRHVMSVHASGDAAELAEMQLDASAQAISQVASSIKGKEGSAVTEGAKEEKRQASEKAVNKQEETATVSHVQEEVWSATAHTLEGQESKPLFEVIIPNLSLLHKNRN